MDSPRPSRPRSGAAIVATDIAEDGTFRIRAAPGGNYVYVRCGEGWEPAGPRSFDVEVTEDGEVEVRFEVRRATDK